MSLSYFSKWKGGNEVGSTPNGVGARKRYAR